MPRVLIAEDEAAIADAVLYALRSEGIEADHCLLAREVAPRVRAGGVDVVVLDVGLPDGSGFDVCRELRGFSDVPVIFLTARNDEIDRVLGLELGADDYVTKPFSPRELIARVAAVLRRTQALPPRQKPPGAERVKFGEWMLDTGQRELIGPDGVAMPLSSGEFRLLTALLERPKIALTRNQLLDLTKGRDADLFDRSIDNHVSRLRKKIEPDPKNPRYIKTVWGGGYIFAMDPEMA